MQHNKKNRRNLVLELFCLFGLCGSIGLEIYYMVDSEASVFYTITTCLLMTGIYLLLSVMERYTKIWNILIPVTQENEQYAVSLALDLKVVMIGMTCYTTVCDVRNIYGNTAFFWIAIIGCILIIAIYKYKMWKINKKRRS